MNPLLIVLWLALFPLSYRLVCWLATSQRGR